MPDPAIPAHGREPLICLPAYCNTPAIPAGNAGEYGSFSRIPALSYRKSRNDRCNNRLPAPGPVISRQTTSMPRPRQQPRWWPPVPSEAHRGLPAARKAANPHPLHFPAGPGIAPGGLELFFLCPETLFDRNPSRQKVLKYIQQEKFLFVAWSIPPFYVDLRPDFCGPRLLFPEIGKRSGAKPLIIHVVKSIFTAEVTTKIVTAANSVDETAAGAHG